MRVQDTAACRSATSIPGRMAGGPARALTADIRARGLLTHEAGGFGERGLSGTLSFDPAPGTERGLSVNLTQPVGGAARTRCSIRPQRALGVVAERPAAAPDNSSERPRRCRLSVLPRRLRNIGRNLYEHRRASGRSGVPPPDCAREQELSRANRMSAGYETMTNGCRRVVPETGRVHGPVRNARGWGSRSESSSAAHGWRGFFTIAGGWCATVAASARLGPARGVARGDGQPPTETCPGSGDVGKRRDGRAGSGQPRTLIIRLRPAQADTPPPLAGAERHPVATPRPRQACGSRRCRRSARTECAPRTPTGTESLDRTKAARTPDRPPLRERRAYHRDRGWR